MLCLCAASCKSLPRYMNKANCFVLFLTRQLTGAQIKIADPEDDSDERDISITGTPDAIRLAQLLINSRYAPNV